MNPTDRGDIALHAVLGVMLLWIMAVTGATRVELNTRYAEACRAAGGVPDVGVLTVNSCSAPAKQERKVMT
jgi:hypothetical protein